MKFTECTIENIEERAYLLAKRIISPTCIFLWGVVGSGKTTFARAFIRSYFDNSSIKVPSPTFNIMQIYRSSEYTNDTQKNDILHTDLYRIKNQKEIEELGLEEEFFKNISLVEWPDRLQSTLFPNLINIYFNLINEHLRSFAVIY